MRQLTHLTAILPLALFCCSLTDAQQPSPVRAKEANGKSYNLSTEYANLDAQGTSKTKRATRRGGGLGAVGAGFGSLAGGGSGATIGAAAGGGVGAISAAGAKGKQLDLPAESRLIFSLKAPVPMN